MSFFGLLFRFPSQGRFQKEFSQRNRLETQRQMIIIAIFLIIEFLDFIIVHTEKFLVFTIYGIILIVLLILLIVWSKMLQQFMMILV